MVIIPSEKPDVSHTLEIDQPPAYDTITPQPPNQSSVPNGTAPSVAAVASSSPNLTLPSPSPTQSPSDSDHSLSLHRSGSDLRASTITIRTGRARLQKPRKRPSSSWLSLLPFTNARSAKQVRKSVLATIRDLVVLPGHPHISAPPDPYEVLSSCANTCAERRLSLSEILQEPSVADHTPIYWAIVNYRGPLLVALLTFAGQLGPDAVSDVRRACLVCTSLTVFREYIYDVCTTASDSLLLGSLPPDEVLVRESGHDGAFSVEFDVILWQRRMRAVGRTSVEFIASGRMWCITFFSTDAPSLHGARGKFRSGGTWNVMVTLLESSPPTYVDGQLIIPAPPPSAEPPSETYATRRLHPHSPHSPCVDKIPQMRGAMYDYNYDGRAHQRFSSFHGNEAILPEKRHSCDKENLFSPSSAGSSSRLPPPLHPLRTSLATRTPASTSAVTPTSLLTRSSTSPITVRLRSQGHKLARRGRLITDPSGLAEALSTKPESWSDNGLSYTSAVIAPLAEGTGSQLLYERSQYLFSDGSLRARFEAKLVKSELSKDCIIC